MAALDKLLLRPPEGSAMTPPTLAPSTPPHLWGVPRTRCVHLYPPRCTWSSRYRRCPEKAAPQNTALLRLLFRVRKIRARECSVLTLALLSLRMEDPHDQH